MSKSPSYSANATLMSCPQKYFNSYVKGYESMDENVPAFAGQCMAEALLWIHTEGKDQWKASRAVSKMNKTDVTAVHNKAVEVLENAWGDFKHHGKYDYLTVGHLETVLWYYLANRDPLQVQPLSEGGSILAEQKTSFDWPMQFGNDVEMVRVTGIPDIPAVVAGQNAIVDWKCTTMYVNDWWAKKFSVIGHQLRTYMEMLRHQYGIHTEVAYVDGIHIGKKAAEGDAAWKNLKSVRSRLFGPFNFTESQRRETWEWYKAGEDMKELFAKTGRWPQNENACSDYGGCEFQSLCGMSPKVRDARGPMLYRIKEEV